MKKEKFLDTCFTNDEWLTAIMLSRGYTIKTIADRLSVSTGTVSGHIAALVRETGTRSKTAAIAKLAQYI